MGFLEEIPLSGEWWRMITGGGGGIRTPGKLSLPTVFKTVAIDHSATPPRGKPNRLDHAM